jgi:hypothetical protein
LSAKRDLPLILNKRPVALIANKMPTESKQNSMIRKNDVLERVLVGMHLAYSEVEMSYLIGQTKKGEVVKSRAICRSLLLPQSPRSQCVFLIRRKHSDVLISSA